MRPFITILLLASLSVSSYSQNSIDQVLRKYRNDEGVVSLNFTGEALKQFATAAEKIKSTVESVDVLVFEKGSNVSPSDLSKIQGFLTTTKYDKLVDVKHKDGKVKLYAIDNGPYLSKIYAIVNSPEMNAYVEIKGKVIFSELGELGLNFNEKANFQLLKSFSKK